MGTAVLSPQDCLSSPHNRQNHNFAGMLCRSPSAPRATSRSGSRPSLLPPQDLAKMSAGLLPLPDGRLHSRQPLLSRTSSIKSYISSGQSTAGPYHTSSSLPSSPSKNLAASKSGASRAASTGLPPRSNMKGGYPRDFQNSINGRLPLKMVQGNQTTDSSVVSAAYRNHSTSTKFVDSKINYQKKKRLNGNEHVGDYKKRTHLDFSLHFGKDASKPLRKLTHEDGETKGQMEDKLGGRGRQLRRASSGIDNPVKVQAAAPVVTILQRPKDRGAAEELIAKFFQKTCPQDGSEDAEISRLEDEALKALAGSKECLPASPTRDEAQSGSECVDIAGISAVTFQSSDESSVSEGSVSIKSSSGDPATDVLSLQFTGILSNEQWFSIVDNERWAGPGYYNSPPPSSLPLPSFYMKPSRVSSLDLSQIMDKHVADTSKCTWSGTSTMKGVWDTAFATKDLKRMLNLESCSL